MTTQTTETTAAATTEWETSYSALEHTITVEGGWPVCAECGEHGAHEQCQPRAARHRTGAGRARGWGRSGCVGAVRPGDGAGVAARRGPRRARPDQIPSVRRLLLNGLSHIIQSLSLQVI